ncbi:hypothetical protein QLS71_003945 [Mariniflexile litorale]|uniref:Holin-X, holin superfamily III n=1 Tax=Mariniflexile litorale TaxID=3045158 RepID=A0AAU7EIN1_9FLAO|nr:hypothetical protein [Mariniflexile sp. KMM 9835]MDQ8210172.1 hypothetical protein [Mariniflexile sp. KMM 9835]
MNSTNMVKSIDILYEKAKKYTETSAELVALHAVDKTADVLSSLTSIMLIIIVVTLFTLFINVGLSLFIGSLLNAYYLGFFIVSGFYLVLAFVLYKFKDKLIKTPVANLIIAKLLKSKKSEIINQSNHEEA